MGACLPEGDSFQLRVHQAPAPDSSGRCPLDPPRETPAQAPDDIETLRLSWRIPGGPLLCDAVMARDGRARSIALPDGAGEVELVVELYRRDRDANTRLHASGTVTALARDELTGEISVLLSDAGRFRCAPGRLVRPRAFHSATPLPNGDVLLIGGLVPSGAAFDLGVNAGGEPTGGFYATDSVELYDARRGVFRELQAPGLVARAFHDALLLTSATDGTFRLLLTGGVAVVGDPTRIPAADGVREDESKQPFRFVPAPGAISAPSEIIIYDPSHDSLTVEPAGANSASARLFGATTHDGSPPLAAGGWTDYPGLPDTTLDLLDPRTGARRAGTAVLPSLRAGATLTRLDEDVALLLGGNLGSGLGSEAIESTLVVTGLAGDAPLVSPTAWTPDGPPLPARAFHTSTALNAGQLLVVGGFAVTSGVTAEPTGPLAMVLTYAPGGTLPAWTPVGPVDAQPVAYHDAIAIVGGDVLVTGGSPMTARAGVPCPDGALATHHCAVRDAWRWSARTATFALLTGLLEPRFAHRSATLAGGGVLLTGGLAWRAAEGALIGVPEAELYNPHDGTIDPLLDALPPGATRAPGDVARNAAGQPVAFCPLSEVAE